MDDQRVSIIAERREIGKGTLHRRRVTWRFDVFHAPVGVKLLHVVREIRGRPGKGAEQKPAVSESQNPAVFHGDAEWDLP